MSKATEYASAQREALCKALHISEEQYSQELFKAGIYYAESTSFNAYMASIKTHHPIFWRWFTNQFAIVDELFLKCYQYNGNDANVLQALKGFWIDEHYPKQIVVFPPTNLLAAVKEEVISE
jgi:hypothetical protein